MQKRVCSLKILIAALLFSSFAVIAYAAMTCSQDGTLLSWTGKTNSSGGRLLYEHKCMNGHVFWLDSVN